jgi:non-ribosomal peptide synthetase component F
MQGERLDAQLSYWKKQLHGAPASLALPTDRPRPAEQTFHGAKRSFSLPEELIADLRALCRREGVTLFMALLAAFKILLRQYSHQEDILVGSNIANRNRTEVEGLIGFFSNMLVLRTNLSGNPTFRELLGRVREVALGAYTHQDVPFDKLVEALNPKRDLSRSPLFQVVFSLHNAPMPPLRFAGLVLTPLDVDNGTAKYDLIVNIWDGQGELTGSIEYNTDLYDGATIARMLKHFEKLLSSIIADPDTSIDGLDILSEQEKVFVTEPIYVEKLESSFSF